MTPQITNQSERERAQDTLNIGLVTPESWFGWEIQRLTKVRHNISMGMEVKIGFFKSPAANGGAGFIFTGQWVPRISDFDQS